MKIESSPQPRLSGHRAAWPISDLPGSHERLRAAVCPTRFSRARLARALPFLGPVAGRSPLAISLIRPFTKDASASRCYDLQLNPRAAGSNAFPRAGHVACAGSVGVDADCLTRMLAVLGSGAACRRLQAPRDVMLAPTLTTLEYRRLNRLMRAR